MPRMKHTALLAVLGIYFIHSALLGISNEDEKIVQDVVNHEQYFTYIINSIKNVGYHIAHRWNSYIQREKTQKNLEATTILLSPLTAQVEGAQTQNSLDGAKKLSSRKHHKKHKSSKKKALSFQRPSYISRIAWNAMRPYFLPKDHPLRKKLDKMFTKKRVTANSQTLTAEGFYGRKDNHAGRFSHATVACHEKFSGYVLKFFTDDSTHKDWHQLKKRIDGSKSLQAAIERHGWQKWFKTPNKWIYPLPESPPPEIVEGIPVKGFILIAEDMLLLKRDQNYRRWRQGMTEAKLSALCTLLQEEGLLDSVYPFNIPFSFDGRIAFIDLEHNHLWPVPFFKLKPYLSSQLQPYWEKITNSLESASAVKKQSSPPFQQIQQITSDSSS